MLRPIIIFLIGIILITLSFTFWFFAVSPLVTRSAYSLSESAVSETIANQSNLVLYFGNVTFQQHSVYNKSRPVDYSFDLNLSVNIDVWPSSVTVYVRDTPIFTAQTNKTIHIIVCDTTKFNNSSYHPTGTLVFPDVNSAIPISLLDAFSGGTTPYLMVQNLNTTLTAKITYGYTYNAFYRSSNGIPLVLFIIGAIIAVGEGVTLLRYVIRRARQR
jgi:hypothetical protein